MILIEDVEIEFVVLECGHTVTPYLGAGVCSECGKACCGNCLQIVKEKSVCPSCFKKVVESSGKRNKKRSDD